MKCFVVTRINWHPIEETDDQSFISNCFPVRVFAGANAETRASEYVQNQTKAHTPEITYQVDDCTLVEE